MARRYYSSTAARTTLASSCVAGDTSLSVTAVSGWPSSFPYTLCLDESTVNEELVEVTARSGTTLTVTRGVDGTSAVAHSAGATVNHAVSARDFSEPNAFLNAGGTVSGTVLVSANSASNALEVRQTGAGNAFVVEDSANPDSTPVVVDASGNVGVGTGSPAALLDVRGVTSVGAGAVGAPSLTTTSDLDTGVWFPAANTVAASTGGSERVRIDSSGQITTGLGSAASPVLSFSGDTNTGFYSPGADQVGIATAGTARVVVDSSGNVCFGTATPAARVHVDSADMLQTTTANNAFAQSIIMQKDRAGAIVNNGDTVGQLLFKGYDGGAYRTLASLIAQVDAAPGASDMPGRLAFYTVADGGISSTERMRIDNAGLITGTGTSLGAWTAWTPSWTNLTVGNGTQVAAYCQIGKVVHWRLQFTFGSTSSVSANMTIAVPVTRRNAGNEVVTGYYRDASASTNYLATAFVGDQTIYTKGVQSDATYVGQPNTSATIPFTWAESDVIYFSGTYEAA